MNPEITIYSISDPRDNEIFYVGQTKNLKRRISQHKSDPCSIPLYKKMEELKSLCVSPKYDELEFCSKEVRYERELFWIIKFIYDGFELTNRQFRELKMNRMSWLNVHNDMAEELLKMELSQDWTDMSHLYENYDVFITIKSRLKRKNKGQWQSKLNSKDKTLYIRRTA